MGLLVLIMLLQLYYSFLQINSFQHILKNIFGFTYVCIQLQGIKATPVFMSQNLWIHYLAGISLPWWSTPCMIHSFTLTIVRIMWYVKVKAHQLMCTKLTLNLKLMSSTTNHHLGVVTNVIFKKSWKQKLHLQ
jgi:hypothetical protein